MSTDAPRPTGALAISPTQTEWTGPQQAALSTLWKDRNGRPRWPDEGTALSFLTLCQRTGLDPFARQLYLIERGGTWAPQTAIDGFRVIRDRISQQRALLVGYSPTLFCGADGQWTETWLENGPPAACKLAVEVTGPAGTASFPQVALWREYGSDSSMWRRMPTTMLAKVAEAQALRRAFPQDLSGLYTADEMAQAEPAPPAEPAAPASDPDAAALEAQLLALAVEGVAVSIRMATTEAELRACWQQLVDGGERLALALVDVPAAWQRLDDTVDDHVPARLPLHLLVKVARLHLDDDPHAGDDGGGSAPDPGPDSDRGHGEPWPDSAVDPAAHPDQLPAVCAYVACEHSASEGVFCEAHSPAGRQRAAALSNARNDEPADPRQADRVKGKPEGTGKAAMAKARADLAARQAAKAAEQETPGGSPVHLGGGA